MLALSRKASLVTALAMVLDSVSFSKPQTQPVTINPPITQYNNQPSEPPQQPQSPKTNKNWWVRSKTVWFNVGVTALGVAGALFPVADMVLPYAKPFLSPHVYAIAMAVIGAGNVVLRARTQTKLTTNVEDNVVNDTNPTQDE